MADETRWAYLVGALDVGESPPKFLGVDVFSDDAGGVCFSTRRRFLFDIAKAPGSSFGDACARLDADVRARPGLEWVVPWLDGSRLTTIKVGP